jgi:hypothetical protein
MADKQALRYHSYLLRLWAERDQEADGAAIWRCSLEDPHTGLRRGFASLEALLAAVRQELGCPRILGADCTEGTDRAADPL